MTVTARLPPLPERIARLKRDTRGYPVPWFVEWKDGVPDFRLVHAQKPITAHVKHLCWVCGEPLGRTFAFVLGPMCAVNRITSEPPCHVDCADWSARACPFLTQPRMKRNAKDLPDEKFVPGHAIMRNPGAVAVWLTRAYKVVHLQRGMLFEVGHPVDIRWYREGRRANRAAIVESIDSGMPLLIDIARAEHGEHGVRDIMEQRRAVDKLLPAS